MDLSQSLQIDSVEQCVGLGIKKYYFYYYDFIVKLDIRDGDTSNSSFDYSGLFYPACFFVFACVQFFSSISESFLSCMAFIFLVIL